MGLRRIRGRSLSKKYLQKVDGEIKGEIKKRTYIPLEICAQCFKN